jgi:hypothetical protein
MVRNAPNDAGTNIEPGATTAPRSFRITYESKSNWPPLAWLARLRGTEIHVCHGDLVETTANWFSEAVWAGQFLDGDFDETDAVFGSGCRIRNDKAIFVTSGSTVDRLQWYEDNGSVSVSNSIVCLIAQSRRKPSIYDNTYFKVFESTATRGLGFVRTLQIEDLTIHFQIFHNIEWDGIALRQRDKPSEAAFRTYDEYLGYLVSTLSSIKHNAESSGRRLKYRLLGAMSCGYDSPAVCAIARSAGLTEVVSITRSRSQKNDSGQEIAAILGLCCTPVERDDWRRESFPEAGFLASDGKGEDVYMHGARAHLAGRVLLTGHRGDRVWEKGGRPTADLSRGDQCGLSLTEYRLWAGFLHCPVPFLGSRQEASIKAIGRDPSMEPWDLGTEYYNRPIPRRILEGAGVRRGMFATHKGAASVLFWEHPSLAECVSKDTYEDLRLWFGAHGPRIWRRQRLFGWLMYYAALIGYFLLSRGYRRLGRFLIRSGEHSHISRYLWPWAIDRATRRYGSLIFFVHFCSLAL